MNHKNDMTLHVGVNITGSWDADNQPTIRAQYQQLDSNPRSKDVVKPNGDIDLNNMEFDGKHFNKNTDITFTLSADMDNPTGQPMEVRFPDDPREAVVVKLDGKPTTDGMIPRAGANRMSVVLDDENKANTKYDYTLNVLVTAAGPARGEPVACKLDPIIVNRRQ